nr:unnamed protein product [Callosobruchus analis]
MTSVSCIRCAKVVKNCTYSIKCQTCLNWLHRDCADITIDDIKKYERELKLPDSKRFRCFICLPQSPKNKTRTANDMSISDGSSIDVLFERIKLYLDERLDTHMTKIMEENAKLANVFQTKIANMEVEVRKISSLENKVAQLEQQLTMLTAKIEESDSKHTSIPENPQEERDNSTQKIDVIREINERQLRKKNLIVFNLTEADGGNTTDKNIQCLRNKVEHLELCISTEIDVPDVLCITEHWMEPEEHNFVKIEGYVMKSVYTRRKMKHGGACILTRKHIDAE